MKYISEFRDPQLARQLAQAIAREAGIAKLKVHDLRRTCGCRLLQDHRLEMAEVSRWLGHATTDITEAAYAFLEAENLHDAIGGRVIDNAARLRLAKLLGPADCAAIGIEAGKKELLAIEDRAADRKAG